MFIRAIFYYVMPCRTLAVDTWTNCTVDICPYDTSQQYEKQTLLTCLLYAVQSLATNSYLLQLVKM